MNKKILIIILVSLSMQKCFAIFGFGEKTNEQKKEALKQEAYEVAEKESALLKAQERYIIALENLRKCSVRKLQDDTDETPNACFSRFDKSHNIFSADVFPNYGPDDARSFLSKIDKIIEHYVENKNEIKHALRKVVACYLSHNENCDEAPWGTVVSDYETLVPKHQDDTTTIEYPGKLPEILLLSKWTKAKIKELSARLRKLENQSREGLGAALN